MRAQAGASLFRRLRGLDRADRREEIDRNRKHDGRAFVARDVAERLQVAELHRLRLAREHLRGLEQLLRRLVLALGVDDLRAPLALRLRLPRDGPDHRLVEIHLLDLHQRHLDPPRIGLGVEHALDVHVHPLPLREELVERVLAQHRAERRLRELARRDEELGHLDHRLLRLDHAEVDDRVDLHRDVVARDHVLRRVVEHDRAQVHPHHLLDAGNDDDEARSLDPPEAAEQEHDPALVLAQHAQRRDDEDDEQQNYDASEAEAEHGQAPFPVDSSGTTSSTRPSRPVTLMRCPRASGTRERTRHCSLWMRAQPSPSKSSSTRPPLPGSSSLPETTGRRRALIAAPETKNTKPAVNAASAAITEYGIPNAGTSVSIKSTAPITNATMPPTPSAPKLPMNTSATMQAMPSRRSPSPA